MEKSRVYLHVLASEKDPYHLLVPVEAPSPGETSWLSIKLAVL